GMSAGDGVFDFRRGVPGAPSRRRAPRTTRGGGGDDGGTRIGIAAVARTDDAAADGGTWPRTTRVLPWMLAAFLAMVWLVPFDSASLPVHLPFESKLDRVVIILMAFVWLAALLVGGRAA